MDGVLADFDGELIRRGMIIDRSNDRLNKGHIPKSEWTEGEKERDEIIKEFMSIPGFFRNLEMIEGADKLWEVAGNPTVLTARPKRHDTADRVRNEKRDWITQYFGEIPDDGFICCLRSEKANYATEHGGVGYGWTIRNILVDDLEWNCTEWEKAGGIAIHFRNINQAIKDLKIATN